MRSTNVRALGLAWAQDESGMRGCKRHEWDRKWSVLIRRERHGRVVEIVVAAHVGPSSTPSAVSSTQKQRLVERHIAAILDIARRLAQPVYNDVHEEDDKTNGMLEVFGFAQ
ncbi:hypothetical protein KIN20_021113 [Parelaphostrongylus tenuis]|uniref:Uncharacterized protein n=1 Tax=Parelaphostrongylus tenuis TaxID=148309 RepID=A0AAD5N7I1_PARTN|nr:hypothetical protein KIN20_021109 [Parelaphostrongylus tenuis]KAJ1361776.1 hypothetical protein KIN20_021113 [Parelaphostrongylus tenuis]